MKMLSEVKAALNKVGTQIETLDTNQVQDNVRAEIKVNSSKYVVLAVQDLPFYQIQNITTGDCEYHNDIEALEKLLENKIKTL